MSTVVQSRILSCLPSLQGISGNGAYLFKILCCADLLQRLAQPDNFIVLDAKVFKGFFMAYLYSRHMSRLTRLNGSYSSVESNIDSPRVVL